MRPEPPSTPSGRCCSLAADAVVSFSTIPLKIASVLGLVVALLGIAYGAFTVIERLLHHDVVPGYTTLVVAVLVVGGVQLACLGIIGQYLGRVYEEGKGRPLFILWEDTRQPLGDDTWSRTSTRAERGSWMSAV